MSVEDQNGRLQLRGREHPWPIRYSSHTEDVAAKHQPRTVPFDEHRSSMGAAFAWGLLIGAVLGGIAVDLWLQSALK